MHESINSMIMLYWYFCYVCKVNYVSFLKYDLLQYVNLFQYVYLNIDNYLFCISETHSVYKAFDFFLPEFDDYKESEVFVEKLSA